MVDGSPLWLSIQTALLATALVSVSGTLAGWLVFRWQHPGRAWLDGLLTLPLVLPPTVTGFLLLLAFGNASPLGRALAAWGLPVVFTWGATVLAAYVVAFPLMYRAAIGALEQVDMALVQAARTLGAGEWRILRTVLIPAAGPGLLAGVTLSFARALGEFGATLLLAGNLPGRTQTLPVALYFDVEAGRWGRAALWVAVTLVFAAAAMAVLHVVTRRPTQTGVLPLDVLSTDSPAAVYRPLPPPTRTQGELDVAVQHHLPSFTLQVNWHLRQQSVCVLGPSGAGKTMLLHALAGLLQPQQSRIVLRGRTLTDSAAGVWVPPAQRRVALVPQQGALFPHMTVRQNVAYGVAQLPDAQRRQQVETALALFRIQRWAERRPGTLSGGQRQRVALARAWARQPDLLLLDEPFSALDAPLREGLQADWLHALPSFAGQCVLVSHDVQEAMRLAADLLLLDDGHVVAHGPGGQLLRQPPSKRAAELLGYRNLFAAQPSGPARVLVADWSEEVPVQTAVPPGTRWLGIREQGLQLSGQPGQSAIACRLLHVEERLQDVLLVLQPGRAEAAAPLYAALPYPEWQGLAGRRQAWWLTVPPGCCFCLEI